MAQVTPATEATPSPSPTPAAHPAAHPAGPTPATTRPHPVASDWRLGVWRAFLRAHAGVTRQLERELAAQADIPLAWYDVLLQLAEAPDRRLRMAELADRVLLSRSGLTRLVDRLQAEQLVVRQPSPDDARGTYTVLTPHGLAALRRAAPIHLAGIQRHWLDHFSDDDLTQLRTLLAKLEAESVAE